MRHVSVQARCGLEAIADDVVGLVGDDYRAVLEVDGVNFGLQGEREQEATLAGFAAFLNSLTFPIQVLVRGRPIDVAGYLAQIERHALHLPGELADLARDHAAFVRRLARTRTLLERRFYLVVPAHAVAPARRSFTRSARTSPGRAIEQVYRQLTFRCEEIERQLARCGLTARRLRTLELAQLFFACWCPELARAQRLARALADYTTPVVRGRTPVGGTT